MGLLERGLGGASRGLDIWLRSGLCGGEVLLAGLDGGLHGSANTGTGTVSCGLDASCV